MTNVTWRVGGDRRSDAERAEDEGNPRQEIDFINNDASQLRNYSHWAKIMVYGRDCDQIAAKIVLALNPTLYQAILQHEDERNVEHSMSIQFIEDGPDVLAAVFRWWRNRHAEMPDHFARLLAVKIYSIRPQRFDADGYLPSDHGLNDIEWKHDWPGEIDPNIEPVPVVEPEQKTVADCMPGDWSASEYSETPAWKLRAVPVVRRYESRHKRWPGTHRNVHSWLVLANGKAIGWNEGPQGWSFPVIKYSEAQ